MLKLKPLPLHRILRALAGGYLLAIAVLFVAQRHYIFLPTSQSAEAFAVDVQSLAGASAARIAPFDAVVLEPSDGRVRATAVFFHGNAGRGIDRMPLAQEFLARGYRLVLAEYPGYAARPGSPSESVLVEDARALYVALAARYPQAPLVVVGESLGSGVAVQVAATALPAPERLVLLTPFRSMVQVAQEQMPIAPVKLLLWDRFESDRHIVGFTGPVYLLTAQFDELVTAEAGEQLRDIAAERSHTVLTQIAGAKHNTWWLRTTQADWDLLLGRPQWAAESDSGGA